MYVYKCFVYLLIVIYHFGDFFFKNPSDKNPFAFKFSAFNDKYIVYRTRYQ